MTEKRECPLCGQALDPRDLAIKQSERYEDAYDIQCRVCGDSTVTLEARAEIGTSLSEVERSELASWVREQTLRRHKPPLICSSSYTGSDDSQDYRINQILETLVPRSICERLDRVLENLGALAGAPGERCRLTAEDHYLCFARSSRQMHFFLEALQDSGRVKEIGQGWQELIITFEGWKRIGELQSVGARGDQAFVAMWLDDKMQGAWDDGLYAGIKAAGYRPLRMKELEHNEKICDRLIVEIRRSGLVVADMTGHRQSVYFEAGYAMGLGIPVIWTCRKDQVKKCHFDTRQYNHIVWETPAELAEALEHRIRATIGEPRNA